MWKWHCPGDPMTIWEHHSLQSANQSILFHLLGSDEFHLDPCKQPQEAHRAYDDGVPCDQERFTGRPCRIPYVRGRSIVEVVNDLKTKGLSNVEIAKRLSLSEEDVRKRLR